MKLAMTVFKNSIILNMKSVYRQMEYLEVILNGILTIRDFPGMNAYILIVKKIRETDDSGVSSFLLRFKDILLDLAFALASKTMDRENSQMNMKTLPKNFKFKKAPNILNEVFHEELEACRKVLKKLTDKYIKLQKQGAKVLKEINQAEDRVSCYKFNPKFSAMMHVSKLKNSREKFPSSVLVLDKDARKTEKLIRKAFEIGTEILDLEQQINQEAYTTFRLLRTHIMNLLIRYNNILDQDICTNSMPHESKMRLFDQVDFYHAFSEASAINILSYDRFLYEGPDLIHSLWPHLRVDKRNPDLTMSSGDASKSIYNASKSRIDTSKSHTNPSQAHIDPSKSGNTYMSKSGNTFASKSGNTFSSKSGNTCSSKSGNTFASKSQYWYSLLSYGTNSTDTDTSASNTDSSGSSADSLGSDNGKVNWPEIKTNFIDFVPPVFVRNGYLRARKKADEEFKKKLKDTKLKGTMHSPSTGLAFGWKKKNLGGRKEYGFFYDKYVTTAEGPSQCEEVIEEVILDASTSDSDIDEEMVYQINLDSSRSIFGFRSSSHMKYTSTTKNLGTSSTSKDQVNPFIELLQLLCCRGM